MEGAERDSTQDWLVPAGAGPPLLRDLEIRIDEALAIARSSEQAVNVVGEAALDAARQARRAAELAESASAVALEASRAVSAPGRGQESPAPVAAAGNGGSSAAGFSVAGPAEQEDDALRRFTERADRVVARLQAVGS
jgi:hypothetical protein